MNTNIVISLDKRRIKKDGTYPIVLRLGHNERTTSIPIGISIKDKDWDDKNRSIKKSYTGTESITRLNNALQKKKAAAMDILLKLHEKGMLSGMTVTALRNTIEADKKMISFFDYTSQLVTELLKENRIGTARSYKCVSAVLKKYNQLKDLSFEQINYLFLNKFQTNHIAQGYSPNGVAVYMRTIRAIFNKAIKEGIIGTELYPFTNFKIKTIPTQKRALDWKFLKKIIELTLPKNHSLFQTRNYFLSSYMMYGMNFTDMAFLKKSDINNGRITYRRKKTSKLYDIKITPPLKTILSSFSTDTAYVFPIIKREQLIDQYKDIAWAQKRYNKKLKLLADKCGISDKLSSYVSRHSFATQAMLHDVPLNAISSMLGHSSLKTTEIYLKSLPANILDEYNSRLFK